MLTKEELEKLDEESVEELTGRVQLASLLIKSLGGDEDPRAEGAMERLRVQQEQINTLIALKTMDMKPEPVVVDMQPASVAGRFIRPN